LTGNYVWQQIYTSAGNLWSIEAVPGTSDFIIGGNSNLIGAGSYDYFGMRVDGGDGSLLSSSTVTSYTLVNTTELAVVTTAVDTNNTTATAIDTLITNAIAVEETQQEP